jgi:glycosyltransferase involved in cell wall biosynthesis
VAVVPLRIARGIQNKLLEALAMGVPCVSTAAAWSGTAIPNGDGILAADDPRDFADCVVRLLRDHVFRNDMATKARSVVEANFSWDAQLSTLDRLIAELTRRPLPVVGGARASRIVETAANA